MSVLGLRLVGSLRKYSYAKFEDTKMHRVHAVYGKTCKIREVEYCKFYLSINYSIVDKSVCTQLYR